MRKFVPTVTMTSKRAKELETAGLIKITGERVVEKFFPSFRRILRTRETTYVLISQGRKRLGGING